ncbi:MAG: nucleotide kinase domain-containing protein [Rhodospirillales bacterium]
MGDVSPQFDLRPPPRSKRPRRTGPDVHVPLGEPVPSEVFPTYWKFAALRQQVFFARVEGRPETAPHDDIIASHRFTNAYRASDRVSQYLIRHVIYDHDWSSEDLFFRIMLFKFFNKIETWEALKSEFGEITWEAYSFKRFDAKLLHMMAAGKKIYSAAYIMPSGRSAFGHEKKHQNHLEIIGQMMKDRVPQRVRQQPNLEAVFNLLREYPCIGPFTGYQYTIDLNYSPLIDFCENDFVEAGPGALDGIAKCFKNARDYSPADLIKYMTDNQEKMFAEYAPDFRDLWGRALHKIDCQNLFCEVDKYARKAHPDVAGRSGRTRIKQVYRESPRSVELPFYPPKWELNGLIKAGKVNDRIHLQLTN